MNKLTLERKMYIQFIEDWKHGKYTYQRYGQAFYNFFKLHKLNNQEQLKNLYEEDGAEARRLIFNLFEFN